MYAFPIFISIEVTGRVPILLNPLKYNLKCHNFFVPPFLAMGMSVIPGICYCPANGLPTVQRS